MPPTPLTLTPTRRQQVVLVVTVVVLAAVVAWLLLGPARGARDDLSTVRTEVTGAHRGVDGTLATSRRTLSQLTTQLDITQESLQVQQQGLDVASETQRVTRVGVGTTDDIRRQTTDTLATLREVIAALGPIGELRGDLDTVVAGVDAGVTLARTTLRVARQTLADGREALRIAGDTLATLRQSRDIQQDLLEVGRQTLGQVQEINRKLPTLPLTPAGAAR